MYNLAPASTSEASHVYAHHNHSHCISQALNAAREVCEARGVRLTSLREQVLMLVWQSHKPLGAYMLMEMLAQASTRRVAPPTVYRTLDFLIEEGLIHRINSLNAFIGCPSPTQKHQSQFLICTRCGVAVELDSPNLNQSLSDAAHQAGFQISSHSIEISGLCPTCQGKPSQ